MRNSFCWLLLFALTAGLAAGADVPESESSEDEAPKTESRWSKFVDDEDHSLDLSEWLQSSYGFLPVPLILTEPAIGVGLGAALAFFHDFNTPKEHRGTERAEDYADLPPSMSAMVGAYTTNESWFAALGHEGSYRQDRIRYAGALGTASVNLDLYIGDTPFAYNIDTGFLFQQIKFRLPGTNWFLGGNYTSADTDSVFDLGDEIPGLEPIEFDSSNAGLGFVAYFDNQDNFFTPGRGIEAELEIARFDNSFGGDFDYNEVEFDGQAFHPFSENFILGARLTGATTDGDVPFYGLPFVKLRGVPIMRYQDESVASLELEGRWQIYRRWSVIGFAGGGWTDGDDPFLGTDEDIIAGGVGFRYLIARKLGMHSGVDIAVGPEDTVIYLQFGHAWGR